jgi:phosphoglycolate phosphatase-like HAD superfamily hydrolase
LKLLKLLTEVRAQDSRACAWFAEQFSAVVRTRACGWFFKKAEGHRFKGVHELSPRFEKPHTRGLSTIMRRYGLTPAQTMFIGDSLARDGGVADAMSLRYIPTDTRESEVDKNKFKERHGYRHGTLMQ